jgi:AAA15 family ATPase/GTPase
MPKGDGKSELERLREEVAQERERQEIERLRAELMRLRSNNNNNTTTTTATTTPTTQYQNRYTHGEGFKLQQEVDNMKKELANILILFSPVLHKLLIP